MDQGIPLTKQEILAFSKLLKEDFTLDNLGRNNLIVMCKYMGLNSMGPDSLLRMRLERQLKQIRDDDDVINTNFLSFFPN